MIRKLIFAIVITLTGTGFLLPGNITIYLAGDSTIATKSTAAFPETGWGTPFATFFDASVTIDNRAMNGRSTGSFIKENRWQGIAGDLREGDYVFIQFGHNDEVPTKKTYTTERDFKANLTRFVIETRSKNAHPVLITPVARRKFNDKGEIEGTHDRYSELVRQVADSIHTPLIDLDRKSQQLYQQLGAEASALLFVHLEPGEHPNYPDGKTDNTHFNELGARKIAQLVLADIRALGLGLTERIIKKK